MRRAARRSGARPCSPSSSPSFPASTDPALLVGLAPFDDAAVYRIDDDGARVDHRLLPAARRPSRRLRRDRRGQRLQRRVRDGRSGRAGDQRRRLPRALPALGDRGDLRRRRDRRRRGRRLGRRRAHDPQPRADLRAGRAGRRPPRPRVPQGAAPGPATSSCCRSRSAPASCSPAATTATRPTAIAGMRRLNRTASETLQSLGDAVHAVTDVTGYGLAGHGWEVAERSGVRVIVDASGSSPTRRAGGGRAAGAARVAIRATVTTWPGTSTRPPSGGRRGAVLRPADVGRPARRRRSRRRAAAGARSTRGWWRVGDDRERRRRWSGAAVPRRRR